MPSFPRRRAIKLNFSTSVMIFPINCGSVSSQQLSDGLLRTVLAAQQFLFIARRDDCNEAAVAAIRVTGLLITSASLPVAIQRARNLAAPIFKRLLRPIRQGHDRAAESWNIPVYRRGLGWWGECSRKIIYISSNSWLVSLWAKDARPNNQSNSKLTASWR